MGSKRTLIVNFKNYPAILGAGSVRLARAAESAAREVGIEVIVAPPVSMIGVVASSVKIPVFSQRTENAELGQSTGALIPEAIKAAGADGTILNHSEAITSSAELDRLIPRIKSLGLSICLCARTTREVRSLAMHGTGYLAIEPPELIGTGIAVSEARPELIKASVRAAKDSGFAGRILCGAGIVEGNDVRKAVDLGVDGILVASSVVKAKDWVGKLTELASPLGRS